jgi:hypothetical protein
LKARSLRTPVTLACAALALLLAACGDGPTAPTSFAQVIAGRTWVAVAAPDGLPSAETWTPFVPRAGEAYARLREMKEQAAHARKAGDAEGARSVDEAAALLAAGAVAGDPGAEPVLRADAALERWEANAAARLASGSYPGLDSAVVDVHRFRAEAAVALARRDTASGAVSLTRAAARARDWAPQAVALRVLAAAEARADARGTASPEVVRARRLLRTSREAVATGDYVRAFRRAVYALQMLDADSAARPRSRRGGVE